MPSAMTLAGLKWQKLITVQEKYEEKRYWPYD
jgi:hypothetical protein